MDEENSSENICVGWCRYTHNVELNARSWDTLHHTWDKEFPHMFSAFQLDLLRRWMLCDCICIEHRNTKSQSHWFHMYFRNLSLYFRFTLYVFLAFARTTAKPYHISRASKINVVFLAAHRSSLHLMFMNSISSYHFHSTSNFFACNWTRTNDSHFSFAQQCLMSSTSASFAIKLNSHKAQWFEEIGRLMHCTRNAYVRTLKTIIGINCALQSRNMYRR